MAGASDLVGGEIALRIFCYALYFYRRGLSLRCAWPVAAD
jgi:hypothetical protein